MKIKHIAIVSLGIATLCLSSARLSSPQDQDSQATEAPSSSAQMPPSGARKVQAARSAAKLPGISSDHSLRFEANLGQSDSRVQFHSRGPGYMLFLSGTDAVLSLGSPAPPLNQGIGAPPAPLGIDRENDGLRTSAARSKILAPRPVDVLRVKLVGANRKATAEGLSALSATSNYFIGNDPTKWRTGVPMYASVKYHGIYQGTDLVYYGNQGQLESDFVLAPGADASRIRLRIEGANHFAIDSQGNLVLTLSAGRVEWRRPVIYQEAGGRRQQIEGGYRLQAKNEVGFWMGPYDAAKPLVIDPVLVYSTYLGGSGDDNFDGLVFPGSLAGGIATDSSGNVYVTGVTLSTDFPTLNAAYSTCASCASSNLDVFVAKYSSTGKLVYSTYLGGSSFNYPGGSNGIGGIAVDAVGDAYVTGSTTSPDFPATPGAYQTICGTDGTCNGGITNAFLTALNPSGSGLVYSTFLGGSCGEDGNDVAVDSQRIAYVTGDSCSPEFPITSGALHSPCIAGPGACTQVFVTLFNSSGSSLVWSSLFGGSGGDFSVRIRLDHSGAPYVVGDTSSPDFPTVPSGGLPGSGITGGAFVTTNRGLSWNASNTGLPHNAVTALAVDPNGAVYAGTPMDGVFKSVDSGNTWSPVGIGTVPNGILALAFGGGRIYAAASGSLYWSGDGGTSWSQSGLIPGGGPVAAVVVDPTAPQTTVYVATRRGQVQQSVDGGQNFSVVGSILPTNLPPNCAPPVRSLVIDPQAPAVLYSGTSGCGILQSTDRGATWNTVNIGLGNVFNQGALNFLPIVVDPTTTPSTVYAGILWNVWASSNPAAGWSPTAANFGPGGPGRVITLTLDTSSSPKIIYVGLVGEGARKSTDGGSSWSNISAGLDMDIQAMAVDPVTPTTLYAGSVLRQKGFVAKVDPSGTSLKYSTYLGGNGNDGLIGLAVDLAGDAYVTGRTTSTNFPTTPGVFQSTNHGGASAFVTKLNPTGTGLIYSTLVGGSTFDMGIGLAADTSGVAYVAGITYSTDFPTVNPTLFPTPSTSTCGVAPLTRECGHGFLFQLNPTGTAVLSSTYLGGSGGKDDYPNDLALDATPSASTTGSTSSLDFPILNASQPTYAGGNSDAFVTKIDFSNSTQTLAGPSVMVQPSDSATGTTPVVVTFSNVTVQGNTTLGTSSNAPATALPSNFQLGNPPTFYNISTSATFTGSAQICINYAGVIYTDPTQLHLFHLTGGSWVDVMATVNTSAQTICGNVNSFSPFVILQALKQTPTITWNAPANINSGTALSGSQLNATASVPGTFIYSPAAGTVLTPGTHTLSATFTPTDTTHYNTTAASVSITVNVSSNLTISSGQTYTFVNGKIVGNVALNGGTLILNNSSVGGNITMSNGNLTVEGNSTISGNLQITGGTFSVGPAHIGGSVQIQNLPTSSAQNQICGTTVNGNLQFQSNRTAVSIGSSSCAGNTVGGNLQVANNSASAQVYHNAVSGNLQVQSDTAATAIFLNTVRGNLQCTGNNASLLTGGGNTAAQKQGQCAAF